MEELKQLKEAIAKNQERIEETRLMLEKLEHNLGSFSGHAQARQQNPRETDFGPQMPE